MKNRLFVVTSCSFGEGYDPQLTRQGIKEAHEICAKLTELIDDNAQLYIVTGEGKRHLKTVELLFDQNPDSIARFWGIKETPDNGDLIVGEEEKISLREAVKKDEFRDLCRGIEPRLKALVFKEKDEGLTVIVVCTCLVVIAAGVPRRAAKPHSIYKMGVTDEVKLTAELVF